MLRKQGFTRQADESTKSRQANDVKKGATDGAGSSVMGKSFCAEGRGGNTFQHRGLGPCRAQ